MCGGFLVLFYKVDKEQAKSIGQHFQFSVISQKKMMLQLYWTSPQHGSKGFTLPALLGDKGKLSHLIWLNLVEADP